jgi:hypothetical protein
MEKKFALRYDGFIQSGRYTFEDAKATWKVDSRNTNLYEYDCSVVEVDENGKSVRVVDFAELGG